MTSKQRAYLRSLAMDEDAIIFLGKASLTPENTKNVDEALAARELNVTPSAVSQQVHNLERWLGFPLLERGCGGVVLSDGVGLGHVVLHEPRVAISNLIAENPAYKPIVTKDVQILGVLSAIFRNY